METIASARCLGPESERCHVQVPLAQRNRPNPAALAWPQHRGAGYWRPTEEDRQPQAWDQNRLTPKAGRRDAPAIPTT